MFSFLQFKNVQAMRDAVIKRLYYMLSLPVFTLEGTIQIVSSICLVATTVYLVLNNRKGVKLKQADIEKTELESELLRIKIEKAKEDE